MPKRILIGTLVFFVLYTIFGFLILPGILKSILTKNLTETLHRTVSIQDIDTNPYLLSARVKGLVITEVQTQDTFTSFDELFVNLQASSALKLALIVKEIRLDKPYVKVIHTGSGQYNFSDLMAAGSSGEGTKKEPMRFFLGNIQVTGGKLDVVDSPKNKQHALTSIAFSLPFLSNMGKNAEVFVQPYFEANINGTPFILGGQTKPFHDSLETTFQMNLKGIDIPYYIEYLPREIRIKIPSGTLDFQASLSYTQYTDKAPVLQTYGKLVLTDLSITDMQDLPLLTLPQAVIDIAPSQFLQKKVHISTVTVSSPEAHIRRDKAGTVNFASIVKTGQGDQDTKDTSTEENPLSLTIDQVALKDGTVTFSDSSTTDPVELVAQDLEISARNITTTPGSSATAEIACRLNKKGKVSTTATFGMDPLACDAQISMEGLEPAWVQPYFTDRIQIMVTGGRASTKGSLSLKETADKGMQISYKGNAALRDFASVDKEYKDDFVNWQALEISNLAVGVNPAYLDIKEIALEDFFSRIIVNTDGKLNLSTVVTKNPDQEGPPAGSKPQGIDKIRIDRVAITNGTILFVDRSITPRYTTQLANIDGSISGLTSQETRAATIDLSARLDNSSPLTIKGKINPLKDDLFVDIHTSFKDIDLTPESPYAGKYLGYTIHKGKLSLDLRYLIDKKKLDSQNNVFIDQFTFGDPVESADATGLPVKFAISLLKDPQGRINLQLPVTGRTDDPEFRVGKIILQMLANIIKKAATSPFSALAAMYPGAEQLSYVEFPYGRVNLSPESEQKLLVLLQILTDKPSVNLEIRGYADREKDREGLTRYFFEKKLKAQKLTDMLKDGRPAMAVDEVTIAPDEYEQYLKKAYKAETFPRPKNAFGFLQSLPAPEMERLITEHIEVTDNDLHMLASQRAQQVKNVLVKSQKVNPERIFLVKAPSLSPEKIEGSADARVDLNLK